MGVVSVRDQIHWHEIRSQHIGASDIAALLAAVDRPATPQAVDHFVTLLEQRQSAQASPVDTLDDSPLLPPDLDTSDPEFEQAAEA